MAQAKGKDKAVKAGFEYHRNRTGKTRYEIRVAREKADEAARDKSDATAVEGEALGVKDPKPEETNARTDGKSATTPKA